MHLINNIDTIFPNLGWYTYFLNKLTHIVNRIIRSSIQLVHRPALPRVERFAGLAFATGFKFVSYILTVNVTRQNTCTGRFPNSSGSCEEVGVRKSMILDSTTKSIGYMALPHNATKVLRAVFTG